MNNFTPELIEKAKTAISAEELLELAKAAGVEMTADEAATYFAQLNPKVDELNDDELSTVPGGCGDSNKTVYVTGNHSCRECGSKYGKLYAKTGIASATIKCLYCDVTIARADQCNYIVVE